MELGAIDFDTLIKFGEICMMNNIESTIMLDFRWDRLSRKAGVIEEFF